MDFEEILTIIKTSFPSDMILEEHKDGLMPYVIMPKDSIVTICDFLYRNESTYFDYLACITGVDLGPEVNKMEVIYNLYSIPFNTKFCIKTVLDRNTSTNYLPEIESVSHIWKTADWHEREIFDLLGIQFKNHPDLRRILLPADWEGFPLRKDYSTQEYYHQVKVDY